MEVFSAISTQISQFHSEMSSLTSSRHCLSSGNLCCVWYEIWNPLMSRRRVRVNEKQQQQKCSSSESFDVVVAAYSTSRGMHTESCEWMNEIVGGGVRRCDRKWILFQHEFHISFSLSWLRCKIFSHIMNIAKIGILINKREHIISSDDWNFQLKVKNWQKKHHRVVSFSARSCD